MDRTYLSEAFKKLQILDEEDFNLDAANSISDMSEFINNNDEIEDIYDLDAETPEDVQDSYQGQAILECEVCHSKVFKNVEDVDINEDEQLANIGEECPYCYSADGFKIIGQVAPFCPECAEEEPVESETSEELEEVADEEDEDELSESLSREADFPSVAPAMQNKLSKAMGAIYELAEEAKLRNMAESEEILMGIIDAYERNSKELDESFNINEGLMTYEETWGQTEEDPYEFANEFGLQIEKLDCNGDECTYRFSGSPAAFDNARNAGYFYSMEYDESLEEECCDNSCDEELNESVNKINVQTNEENIEIEPNEDGKFELEVKPLEEEQPEEVIEDEMIAPVDDEFQNEIEQAQEEPEDEIFDNQEDVDFDDFDEESFDGLGESYLKNIYENVESFKTNSVRLSEDNLIVEGIIKFNSGNEKTTQFMFEAKEMSNDVRLKFIGENKQISRGKKSFTLTGSVNEGRLISESLNYNYRTKNAEGKSTRIYGTVKR